MADTIAAYQNGWLHPDSELKRVTCTEQQHNAIIISYIVFKINRMTRNVPSNVTETTSLSLKLRIGVENCSYINNEKETLQAGKYNS